MAKTIAPLLPSTSEFLRRFGERLRLARLRRRLTAKQVAERAGMAPMTLRSLERGGAGVTMGAYLAVMQVLGIERDLDLLGAADPLGRELQDARMLTRGKPAARLESPASETPAKRARTIAAAHAAGDRPAPTRAIRAAPQSPGSAGQWVEKSGFASARTLVGLIDAGETAAEKKR